MAGFLLDNNASVTPPGRETSYYIIMGTLVEQNHVTTSTVEDFHFQSRRSRRTDLPSFSIRQTETKCREDGFQDVGHQAAKYSDARDKKETRGTLGHLSSLP